MSNFEKLPHYFQQRFVYLQAHVWSKIGAESLCDELCVWLCVRVNVCGGICPQDVGK